MALNPPLRLLLLLSVCISLAACSEKQAAPPASAPPSAPAPSSPATPASTPPSAARDVVTPAPAASTKSTTGTTASAAPSDPEEAANWAALGKLDVMPDYFKEGVQPTRDDVMKVMGQERDRLSKELDAIEDFQKKYPKSVVRVDALKMLVASASALEKMSPDGSERAQKIMKSLNDMPDLPAEIAFQATFQGFAEEFQKTTDTKKLPAILDHVEAGTDAFAKKYPSTDESRQLYAVLGDAIEHVAPERLRPMYEKLQKSGDPELSELGGAKLRYMDLKGNVAPIQYTAIDGRKVDLAKMPGKVVLVDFWATWCGPCIEGLPEVIDVYKKYHDKGFEIVGISLDEDRAALEDFVKNHAMPWPEYFDGKKWKNDIAVHYAVQAIPAQWLVDKSGKVVDLQARDNMDAKVADLLADKKIE